MLIGAMAVVTQRASWAPSTAATIRSIAGADAQVAIGEGSSIFRVLYGIFFSEALVGSV